MTNKRVSDTKIEHIRIKFCERGKMDMQAEREKSINVQFKSGKEEVVCIFF